MKNILITGASGALGSRVVQRFLMAGCNVLGTHRGATDALARHPHLHWLDLDLTDSTAIHESVGSIVSKHGPIDALVHCAGAHRWAKIENTTDDEIDFLIGSNLKSTILIVRALLPMMKERKSGRIVLIGAQSAQHPSSGHSVFAATKAGVHALVSAVADEVRAHKITINALLPTTIDSPALRKEMPDADPKSWVTPDQLAELAYELTLDSHSAINGALIAAPGRS